MLINNILPKYQLRNAVRFYRIIHFEFLQDNYIQNNKAYRPRIEQCLQFMPFDSEYVTYAEGKTASEKVAIFGQHNVLNNRKVGRKYLNFQVVFQPGVLYDILKFPTDSLTNIYCNAEDFLGKDVGLVNEQLCHCTNYEQMTIVVENYLMSLLANVKFKEHPAKKIAELMLHANQLNSIAWYASQANLSFRQFDRMFKAITGIAPKEYTNLVCLDKAYLIKNRTPNKDWLSIALEAGFYDYQHLSKTYQKFTGYTPTQFYELEQKAPERQFGDFEN